MKPPLDTHRLWSNCSMWPKQHNPVSSKSTGEADHLPDLPSLGEIFSVKVESEPCAHSNSLLNSASEFSGLVLDP